ncbi:DeoR/GlpR family DNA-binding transcription regulator [Isoptericola sp. b441]|uniref:DeoR/GlpR family DNA-binding transcription regulator n=1 Tax=Actinotalea lenta TaxID=3064654 RepID=A0ABT9DBT7_9CELL|nr:MULTISPECIES: DeoR/GlpR family DNA-binding transcription regulator [unclassified Isoptericola]MDO8108345.1 DeoR/GlpR family DNA-binding transcription regulator [Isoptericola sp. b441]MDO8119744.1 DeoR/GlpR family DNA-binding transcription regulator [Isoptericola sp. b490]
MSRQAEMVDLLLERGFVSVAELARHFQVTESTVRRTLAELEARDLVQRTHGGALPIRQTDAPMDLKQSLHQAEKRAIGRAMAQRILPGQTVLLDSGTTTLEVARHLEARQLTVVTNDLLIGTAIARKQNAHLVFIGGELLPNVYTMWGPTSVQQLQNLRVNVAVFGADTVTEDGIYNTSSYELELKRAMLSIASQAFFVADSSKFGREALFKVFDFDAFTAGITDELMPAIRAAQFPVPLIRASM